MFLKTCLVLLVVHAGLVMRPIFAQPATTGPTPSVKEYADFANGHDGNPVRGREMFFSEKASCAKCHTVDGSAAKAGPDLSAVGDKFPRRELISSILEPSADIAVGYGATLVETKSGEEYLGVLKQITDAWIELMTQTVNWSASQLATSRNSGAATFRSCPKDCKRGCRARSSLIWWSIS